MNKSIHEISSIHGNQIYQKISNDISEKEILYLQNIFLENGIHYFNVNKLKIIRSKIFKVINSLNYFNNIAYLTTDDFSYDIKVSNIFILLEENNFLNDYNKNLYEFFLDFTFLYDFFLIEVSEELLQQLWFNKFYETLIEFKCQNIMPIIFIKEDR